MEISNDAFDRLQKAFDSMKMRLKDIHRIDDTKYNTVMKPLLGANPVKNPVIIGFDTEWHPKTGQLLSIQFAIEKDGELLSKLYYIDKLDTRSLMKYILMFLKETEVHVKTRKMKKVRIYLIAHFALAEISKITDHLSEFKLRTYNKAMSAAASIGAIEDQEYEFELHHRGNVKAGKYFLKILDLFGYFPRALSFVGEMVGLPKLELNRTKIHLILESEPQRFEQYAKRDAEICVLAFNQLRKTFIERFGLDILHYPTTAGLAAAIFRRTFLKEPVVPYREVPKVFKKKKPDGTWVANVRKETIFDGSLDVRRMAMQCYWGGRAECYGRGFLKGDFEYFDVTSLYPSSSLLQPLPNKDTEWIRFKGHEEAKELEGFCRVHFKFPEDQKYPCLPVMPVWASKLYFPLEGRSYCTLSEVKTAVKLGAEILEVFGFGFRPSSTERNHVLSEFIHYFMNLKKSEEKGTLKYEMWKLIINSMIGKLCQRSPEYDTGAMISFMQKTGLSNLSDYRLRKSFRRQQRVGTCWSPEWAVLILGKARSLMGEFIVKGSLFCSTDSGLFPKGMNLNCDALEELRSVGSDFVKEYEGDSVLLVRARMYAILKDDKVVKCARHGSIATKQDFAKIIKQNLKAGQDLRQLVRKTHLSSLKDVVRKGVKLGEEELWERIIKWKWDEKRELVKPNVNIWTEFSETTPIQELPEYPTTIKTAKTTKPRTAHKAPKFGRPKALTPNQVAEIKRLREKGWSIRRLAKRFKVGVATIQRCLSE